MLKLSRYVLHDILRSKVIIAYTLFLLTIACTLFQMEDNTSKALMSLTNIVLVIVPLVSMVFATIHYYNSYEFIELMLSQPVSRTRILLSEYLGTAASLSAAFLVGIGIPILLFNLDEVGIALITTGTLLTFIFTSLAFYASVLARDKARGIGIALLLWFYFALIYDGLVLTLLFAFSDYPLEQITLTLSSLNPVDLGRIFLMLKMDVSALMGYTGATYKDFFGSAFGTLYSLGILLVWAVAPLWLAMRSFNKKDL